MRGPLLVMADWEDARLYLLDGTDLGTLAEIKAAQRKPGRSVRISTIPQDVILTREGIKK